MYVESETNLSGTTNISYASIKNISVFGNTTLNGANISSITNISLAAVNNLVVSSNTNLFGANVSGILNASNVLANNITVEKFTANSNSIFNNKVEINSSTLNLNGGLIVNPLLNTLMGKDGEFGYSSVFTGTMFAEKIVCNDISSFLIGGQTTSLGLAALSVFNKNDVYNDDVFYILFGFKYFYQTPNDILNDTIIPVMFNCYAEGSFIYGLSNYGSTSSTFDLSANAAQSGITYNGPINIGSSNPDVFNVNADSIHFSGGNLTLDNDLIIGGNITSASDKRLKENITPLEDCLSKIKKISGYSFTRNDLEDKNKKYLGLIAQEVEEVFPDLVTETNNTKSINYQSFVAVLLECIKELNDKLENKILS